MTVLVLAVPLPWGVLAVAAYLLVALLHARWILRDPVELAALA
jgi:hypothetical protein